MINTMRVGRFILSLLLIIAGVMGFLINMGYGSWASYQVISHWWPLLLIILGAAMFGQGRIPHSLAYILVVLLVAATVGYMMFNDHAFPFNRGSQLLVPDQKLMAADIKGGSLIFSCGQY